MDRHSRILTPRLQVEVHLPNFDLQKAMGAAIKRQNRRRSRIAQQAQTAQPAVHPQTVQATQLPAAAAQPVQLDSAPGPDKADDFQIEL